MLREKQSKGHKTNRTSGLFYSDTVEKPEAIRTALPKFQVFQSDERLPYVKLSGRYSRSSTGQALKKQEGTNMIGAISGLISLIIELYSLIVVFRVIISWVNPDPYNPIVKFLYSATEPVLYRLRKAIPLQYNGIDFSPLALLVGLSLLKKFIS